MRQRDRREGGDEGSEIGLMGIDRDRLEKKVMKW